LMSSIRRYPPGVHSFVPAAKHASPNEGGHARPMPPLTFLRSPESHDGAPERRYRDAMRKIDR
jgi:hypothetical protein